MAHACQPIASVAGFGRIVLLELDRRHLRLESELSIGQLAMWEDPAGCSHGLVDRFKARRHARGTVACGWFALQHCCGQNEGSPRAANAFGPKYERLAKD